MASLIYDSALEDEARAAIDYDTDTFKAMLVGAAYTENKATHLKRSDVTNEVTGTGYTAGGNTVAVTVTKDTVNHRVDIVFGATTWPASTISGAQKVVIYKARGGAATADELVCVVDNGVAVSTTAGTLSLSASTVRKSNP
jgi:hypothetical protein